MANISITYPEGGLVVSISVFNKTTDILFLSGVAIQKGTNMYSYDFVEEAGVNYYYEASTPGYQTITYPLLAETTSGGGGATVADIWEAQISDYSDTIGSFANKFSNYGGVSHVIEKVGSGGLSDGDKEELTNLIGELKNKIDELEKKGIGKETIREVVRVEKIAVPSIDSTGIVDAIIEGMSELNETLTDTFIEAVGELKTK